MSVYSYSLHGATLLSDYALPLLPSAAQADTGMVITFKGPADIDTRGFVEGFDWCDGEGRLHHRCTRRGEDYLFSFPGKVDFLVEECGNVFSSPRSAAGMELMPFLSISQIVPRYLGSRGCLLLHASAVQLHNGRSVAFLGQSGYGKSTLAGYFHRHGATLLDDDCILLRPEKGRMRVLGGTENLRMNPDSIAAVFATEEGFTRSAGNNLKCERPGSVSGNTRECECLLDALFFLDMPVKTAVTNKVQLVPLKGSEALVSLIHSALCLDPSDQGAMSRNFTNVTTLLNAGVASYALHYPRDFNFLPAVQREVLSTVE